LPLFSRKSFLRRINPAGPDCNKRESRYNPDASGVSREGQTNMFRPVIRTLAMLIAIALAVASALAQTPQPSPAANSGISAYGVIGEVKSIDANARQMVVQTEGGAQVTVVLNNKTVYKRVPPGEKTLDKAVDVAWSDVAEGDRVFARGRVSADQKTVPAQQLIVMSKGEIAKKREAELAEWRRPGVRGVIASVNPATKEFSVSSRTLMGAQQTVVVSLSEKADMKRYPHDSIKFSDAKPSSFEELKAGDQVRAVGERAPDGTRLTADKVLSDPHRIVGGTVTAIDVATGEMKISDLQTKKPITVVIKPDSVIRRVPANLGMMMGGMGAGGPGGPGQAGGTAPGQGQGQGQAKAQAPPAGAPVGQQAGAPGGPAGGGTRMGGGGMNMADLLERFPTIAINDLKVGDTIVMSSTQGADPTRLTAFTIVTGVEPLLQMLAARQQAAGQPRPAAVDLNSNFGGMFGGIGVP
jgi:Cu/Ag efflux protein CusF